MANKNRNRTKNWRKDAANKNYQDAAFARKDDKFSDDARNNARGKKPKAQGSITTTFVTGSSDNDATWYIPNGQLAKDVATMVFSVSNGIPLADTFLKTSDNSQSETVVEWTAVDGVLVIRLFHTMGDASNPDDALNYAGNQMFIATQSANSRTPQYEMPDQLIITHCISEAFAFYQLCVRCYGVMMNWDILDRFTPRTLVEAMGFDFADIEANLAAFRTEINLFALKLNSLYLPKGLDFVNRKIFLYENIYTDSQSRKAQYYLYAPIGFYLLVEGDPDHPSTYAKFKPLNTPLTLAKVRQWIKDFLHPFLNSDDVRNVAADYMKAFGEANVYTVNPIAENYKVAPVYNSEVLSQIENAYISPFSVPNSFSGIIEQNTAINQGSVVTHYTYNFDHARMADNSINTMWNDKFDNPLFRCNPNYVLLNMHTENVSPETTLVASRLSMPPTVLDVQSNGSKRLITLTTKQTELVAGALIYYKTSDTMQDIRQQLFSSVYVVNGKTISNADVNAALNVSGHLSHYDWHPKVTFANHTNTALTAGNNDDYKLSPMHMDIDNFTTIPYTDMDEMNDVVQYGLFMPRNLPGVVSKR